MKMYVCMAVLTMGESSVAVFATDAKESQIDRRSSDCASDTSQSMHRILATYIHTYIHTYKQSSWLNTERNRQAIELLGSHDRHTSDNR